MITKEQVKTILSKKRLTGSEAGRLFMEDSFLVDMGKPGLLTEKEHRHMRSLVRTQEDIEVYNQFLEIYKRTIFTLQEAHVLALSIEANLYYLVINMKEYLDRSTNNRKRPTEINSKDKLDIHLQIVMGETLEDLPILMAYEQKIKEISEDTGVDYIGHMTRGSRRIREAVETYNFYAEDSEIMWKKIWLEKVRPDKKTLKELFQIIPPLQWKGHRETRDQEASDGQEA